MSDATNVRNNENTAPLAKGPNDLHTREELQSKSFGDVPIDIKAFVREFVQRTKQYGTFDSATGKWTIYISGELLNQWEAWSSQS